MPQEALSGSLPAGEPGPVPGTGSAPYGTPPPIPEPLGVPRPPGSPIPTGVALAALAYRYRQQQFAVANQTQKGIAALWSRYIDPARFADSWNSLSPLMYSLLGQQYNMSAANAANYYQNSRVMAGHGYLALPGYDLDAQYAERVMGSMGPGTFFHQVKNVDTDQAAQMASDALQGAGTRLVLNGGRDIVTKSAVADPEARGWERVIEPGACGFCAMLAGRGGVYNSESVKFRAHDHCGCLAEPVFTGQTASPLNAALSEQWAIATKGTRGKAARAAWDQHWSQNDNAIRNSIQSGVAPESGRRQIRSGQ